MQQKTKAWIIAFAVLGSIIGGVMAYDSWKIAQERANPIQHEPSCTFLLYGEICSNVPQGGGGPGGVHGVSLM